MKSTHQILLLFLTAANLPTSRTQPTASTVSNMPLPTSSSITDLDTSLNVTDTEEEDAILHRKCFTFTSENPNWSYTTDPPWTGHGKFGNGPKRICVPTDQQGGAMFIGSEANPQGGNTKFECTFHSQGRANCDLSLVDGYSLSVSCDLPHNQRIGGTKDLWKTGKKCVANGRENEGICINAQGYAPKFSDVTPFFMEGQGDGNSYCIWHPCKRDIYFPVTGDVKCHVSGSHGPGN